MKLIHRPLVILPFLKEDTVALIDGTDAICTNVSGNATLSAACTPAMTVYRGQIDAFVKANGATKTSRGAVPAREAAREVLWGSSDSIRAGIQVLCEASPEQAGAIAASAGMKLKEPRNAVPQLLQVKVLPGRGAAFLKASLALLVAMLPDVKGRGGKRTIFWRYTLDGSKSFVDVEATPWVTTTASGLPLNTDVGFQVSLKDRRGRTAWSQTITVHVY